MLSKYNSRRKKWNQSTKLYKLLFSLYEMPLLRVHKSNLNTKELKLTASQIQFPYHRKNTRKPKKKIFKHPMKNVPKSALLKQIDTAIIWRAQCQSKTLSHTHVGKAPKDKNPGIKAALTSSRVTKAGFQRLDYSVIRLDSDNRVIVRLSIVRQRRPLQDLREISCVVCFLLLM